MQNLSDVEAERPNSKPNYSSPGLLSKQSCENYTGAPVAQRIEQSPPKRKVAGSTPAEGTQDFSGNAKETTMSEQPESPIDNDMESLEIVRRRVLAVGFLSIILHGVVALIWLGIVYRNDGRASDSFIMFFMSGVLAIITCVGTRVILKRAPWSTLWIAVSLAPTVIAVLWR